MLLTAVLPKQLLISRTRNLFDHQTSVDSAGFWSMDHIEYSMGHGWAKNLNLSQVWHIGQWIMSNLDKLLLEKEKEKEKKD